MRGFPKHINTTQDLDNLLATPEFADQAKAKLQEFVDQRKSWLPIKDVTAKEALSVPKGSRIVEQLDDKGAVSKYILEEYKDDPNSKLVALGISVSSACERLEIDEQELVAAEAASEEAIRELETEAPK